MRQASIWPSQLSPAGSSNSTRSTKSTPDSRHLIRSYLKMANSIDENRELQKTYLPNQLAVVRLADAGRVKGRQRMRDGGQDMTRSRKCRVFGVESQREEGC